MITMISAIRRNSGRSSLTTGDDCSAIEFLSQCESDPAVMVIFQITKGSASGTMHVRSGGGWTVSEWRPRHDPYGVTRNG